jgi:hypothetical protein
MPSWRSSLLTAAPSSSTYLGGSSNEAGFGIAVHGAGSAYVIGFTDSPDFPTAHPLQGTLGGFEDAFVAKILP